MNEQTILEVLIRAKDEASVVMNNVANQTNKVGGSLQAMGKNLATAGGIITGIGLAGVAMMTDWVGKASEAQKVTAQLEAVLNSTKGVAGMTKDSVLQLADSLSKVTPYEDEAITSAESMLLTFTKVGKDIFPQATETILNMSTALGQDLQGSAIQLGKALNDPIRGITALRRVGVSFSADQEKMITSLVKSGKTLEAQKLILTELATEFGGSARKAGETFAGQMTILNTKLDNIKETLGGALLPILTPFVEKLSTLADKIASLNPKTLEMGVKFFALFSIIMVVVGAVMTVVGVLSMMATIATAVGVGLGTIVLIVGGVIVAVVALIAIGYLLYKSWTENTNGFRDKVQGVFAWIKTAFANVVTFLGQVWQTIVTTFNNAVAFVTGIPTAISNIVTAIGLFFTNLLTSIGNFITQAITFFANLPFMIIQGLIDLIFVQIPYYFGFLKGYLETAVPILVSNVIAWFKMLPDRIKQFFADLAVNALETFMKFHTDLLNAVTTLVKNVIAWFTQLWNDVVALFIRIGQGIIAGFTNAWTWITTEIPAWGKRVGDFLKDLPTILGNIFEDAKQAVINKLTEAWNKVKEIWDNIKKVFSDLINKAGEANKAGESAGKSSGGKNKLFGGWIPETGMYRLHQGEYVMSRSMLRGNQMSDNRVTNAQKTINLNAIVNSPTDFDVVLNKLSWALNNSY